MVILKKAVAGVSEQALARFVQQAHKATGLRGKVNVVLTSSRDMRALNRRFRGHDQPTDVLSFPPADRPMASKLQHRSGHWPLSTDHFSGDIVISAEIAARNARLYQHPPAQELKILILHGMLHLAGFNHEADGGRMARREERLRRQLGLTNGLIRRSALRPTAVDRRPSAVDRRRRPR